MPPYYNLYQEPGGPAVAQVSFDSPLIDLDETLIYEGLVWIKVQNEDGVIGWYPKRYLQYPTPTLLPSATVSN